MQYRVLKNAWHRNLQMRFEPGEIMPLNHLSQKEINFLVAKGIVESIPETIKNIVAVPPKKRVGTSRKRKKVVVPAKPQIKKKPVVSGLSTHIEKEPVKPVIKLNEEKIENG